MNLKKYHPITIIVYYFLAVFLLIFISKTQLLLIIFAAISLEIIYFFDKKIRKNIIFFTIFGVFFVLIYSLFNHFGETVLIGNISKNPITLEALLHGIMLGLKITNIGLCVVLFLNTVSLESIISVIGKVFPRLAIFIITFIRAIKKLLSTPFKSGLEKTMNETFDLLSEKNESLKARGFGGKHRKSFMPHYFENKDRAFILLAVLFCTFYLVFKDYSVFGVIFCSLYFFLPIIVFFNVS